MAVHANSVISTRINLWDSVLYTQITDMEEFCYDSSTKFVDGVSGTAAGQTEYSSLFSNLSGAIISWMDKDHTSTTDDVIGLFGGYLSLNTMFGIDMTTLDAISEDNVYLMGGMRSTIKGYTLGYWDDWDGLNAARLEADTTTINNAGISSSPSTTLLVANMQDASKEPAMDDIPPKGIPNKQANARYIFDTLGFKNAYENLVMTNKIPSSYYWNGATLFTDDAETFFGWKDFNNGGGIQQSSVQKKSGTYSLYNASGTDDATPDISYKILPKPFSIPDLTNGFRIEFDCYKLGSSSTSLSRVGVANINMDGYNISLDHTSGASNSVTININKRIAGVALGNDLGTNIVIPVTGDLLDTWFKVQFDIYNNGSLVFTLKNGAGTTLGTVSAVDTTYSLMQVFLYGGDSGQYIDNIITSEF